MAQASPTLKCKVRPRLKGRAAGVIIYSTMKTVSSSEMQELDRRTIEDIGVPSIVLMENAGRGVSDIALEMLGGGARKKVAIFCGPGNNGGDGFVAARYLARRGIEVEVHIIGQKSKIKNDPKINLEILKKSGVEAEEILSPAKLHCDLIIDAIFGIGLKGEVKGAARDIIKDLNVYGIPILSADVPSGLDADTGEVLGEAVKAKKTATMQFAKKGFYINKGPEHAGDVVVVDVGILC